jgi:hypothetical protein
MGLCHFASEVPSAKEERIQWNQAVWTLDFIRRNFIGLIRLVIPASESVIILYFFCTLVVFNSLIHFRIPSQT